MSSINLRKGFEYIIYFNSKKVYAVYIGQKSGILFFVDPIKLIKKSENNIPTIPDYLIDKTDTDVTISKITNDSKKINKKQIQKNILHN